MVPPGRLDGVDRFAAVGLGLDRGRVDLVEVRPEWAPLAGAVCAELAGALGDRVIGIEHVGSTAVAGLIAKPILDLAVRTAAGIAPLTLRPLLEGRGWQYRGDAGQDGGLVFVLETRPAHRVAHVHVVGHNDPQWGNDLALRDRLRTDAAARHEYRAVKRLLGSRFPYDRQAYTAGKADLIRVLLAPPPPS